MAGGASLALVACGFDLAGLGVISSAGDASLDPSADSGVGFDAALADGLAQDVGEPEDDANEPRDGGDDAAFEAGLDAGFDAGPSVALRINVNGAAFAAASGVAQGAWTADPGAAGACGPNAFSVAAVHNTLDGPLYVGEAFGDPLVCNVGAALPQGSYEVTLFFAEIYYGAGCAGGGGNNSRVFDIFIEGQKVANNVDVHQLSGGCLANPATTASPVVATYRVDIQDGTLSISMPASKDSAKVSAIKVVGPL